MKHGPEYLWLWTRLALKFANYGGILCRRIGEMVYPVTADDLEAEMKGGFTDVSIKDGVKTLIDASLIYINSDGFMAITGLTITGDPKEPVYTEIVKITRCSKTTVANRIKKHSLENHVVTVGQKKYLSKPIVTIIFALFSGQLDFYTFTAK